METRANYVVIGLFTLAVIAGGFGFVYWFSRAGDGNERATYRVVFDGAVSGLRVGGWVLFNGIKVGEVSDLKLNPANPRQVLAIVTVEKAVPIRADTRVGLDFSGLTGTASIAIRLPRCPCTRMPFSCRCFVSRFRKRESSVIRPRTS